MLGVLSAFDAIVIRSSCDPTDGSAAVDDYLKFIRVVWSRLHRRRCLWLADRLGLTMSGSEEDDCKDSVLARIIDQILLITKLVRVHTPPLSATKRIMFTRYAHARSQKSEVSSSFVIRSRPGQLPVPSPIPLISPHSIYNLLFIELALGVFASPHDYGAV
jgi:hypothetical protein